MIVDKHFINNNQLSILACPCRFVSRDKTMETKRDIYRVPPISPNVN